jgi:hypothetical protein
MRKQITISLCLIAGLTVAIIACNQPAANDNSASQSSDAAMSAKMQYGGFETQEKWGEHLVNIAACNVCHTPKKMTPQGPVDDSSLLLSGYPTKMPIPDIDRKMLESKGLVAAQTESSWIGPWGISFAANLTSDSTGIGGWKEEQFLKAIREGKFMGLDNTRPILPPMPWSTYRNMSDDELKAIFAYLKSTKPVHNIVPDAMPPVTAMKK